MMVVTVSAFIAAAATGAFLRFIMSLAIPAPWTTFTANLIGSLVIGFLFVYLDKYTTATKTVIFVAFSRLIDHIFRLCAGLREIGQSVCLEDFGPLFFPF